MKTVLASLIAAAVFALVPSIASAQYGMYGYGGYGMDPSMAQMEQYMNQQQAIMNQQMQQLEQQMQMNMQKLEARTQQAAKQIVDEYRQRTGDYQTPDHIVVDRAMAEYYAKNPQVWQQMQQNNRRMAEQSRQKLNQTYNEISDMNMESWKYRNEVMDRSNDQFNMMIREESHYSNPVTGDTSTLNWSTPGSFQTTDGFNTFYTDSNMNQHQWNGFGWDQLDEIR